MMVKGDNRQEDRPANLMTVAAVVLLGTGGVICLGLAAATLLRLFAPDFVWGSPGARRSIGLLAMEFVIGLAALWGVIRLKPWTRSAEPVSPSTRRSSKLYWAKELLGTVAIAAFFIGVFSTGNPFAVISNSPLPVWIAAVAIPGWLLSRVLRERWRSSADEHERRASDFGRNAAAGVFLAVTPAWWVAARAGLAPQPDAMALWILIILVSTIGWAWRRSN